MNPHERIAHRNLNPARLPIPPPSHVRFIILHFSLKMKRFIYSYLRAHNIKLVGTIVVCSFDIDDKM